MLKAATLNGSWAFVGGSEKVIRDGEEDLFIDSDVAVYASEPSEMHIAVRDVDHVVHHKVFRDGAWSAWTSVGGVFRTLGNVSLVGWGRDVWVAARTLDNHVAVNEFSGGTWRGWDTANVGGQILGDPKLLKQFNRLDLFVRGLDNRIYTKVRRHGPRWPTGWQAEWTNLGATAIGSPVVVSRKDRFDVFHVGTDNAVRHKYFDGAWKPNESGNWEVLDGELSSPEEPTIVAWNAGPTPIDGGSDVMDPFWRIDIFAQWTDNSVHQRSFQPITGWSGWQSLGGTIGEGMAVDSIHIREPRVVVHASDGTIWEKRRD